MVAAAPYEVVLSNGIRSNQTPKPALARESHQRMIGGSERSHSHQAFSLDDAALGCSAHRLPGCTLASAPVDSWEQLPP